MHTHTYTYYIIYISYIHLKKFFAAFNKMCVLENFSVKNMKL